MLKFKKQVKRIVTLVLLTAIIASTKVFAISQEPTGIVGTQEVTTATENLKRVITSIAIPLGSIIIFASIVITALKMIFNSNNPNKRSESIGSLAWITGGGVLLGLSLVVAGIILNVATNGTGQMV